MEILKIKSAHLKAEIAHILGSDTASLKQVFSLIGELEVVTRELHQMESSMRRAIMLIGVSYAYPYRYNYQWSVSRGVFAPFYS